MARLRSEQNTKVVQFYLQEGSVIETKRKYRSIFGPKCAPSSRAISRLTQNFIETGTTSEKLRSGSRPIVSDDKVDNIWHLFWPKSDRKLAKYPILPVFDRFFGQKRVNCYRIWIFRPALESPHKGESLRSQNEREWNISFFDPRLKYQNLGANMHGLEQVTSWKMIHIMRLALLQETQ